MEDNKNAISARKGDNKNGSAAMPEVVAQTVMIPIGKIDTNHGQIEGLPKNPRVLRDEQFQKLKKSLVDNPEMLTLRELLVYEHEGKYVVIGGNMRLRVLQDLGEKFVPCKIIPATATVDQLKAYTIKDNVSGGEWNWDDIANEWDVEQLADFGLDNAMLQQWDELPYIEEEQEDPTLDKDIKLTVVIPFAEKDIKSQVESKVKDALREFPNVTLKW